MRLAVFDLDGTLVNSLPDLTDSAGLLLAEHGFPALSEPQVRSMIGDGVAALVQRALDSAGPGAAGIDRKIATERFMEIYSPRVTLKSRLFPGTKDVLLRLRAENWRLAVCTNKPVAAARDILRTFGILEDFAAIGGGDSFPTRKPDAGHLLGTIEAAGGLPRQSVMIGDHANDMLAGRHAGVRSIYAEWGYGVPGYAEGAAAVAASIAEVPDVADRLLPT
ncbi:HAD-IA family hydrolase [Acetobacter conturbans]|uniref:phosphoglycolate phosphatase n=1 Tax=Acetobacter conturbans TaxID=1737472 RepID=A0ABX0JY02_9PROT|nr:HAD-IA family hydrolase [Acetobacter conturbans]NHN88229.1 HAD-IA family hydrolase [Acetobacter conturbans]